MKHTHCTQGEYFCVYYDVRVENKNLRKKKFSFSFYYVPEKSESNARVEKKKLFLLMIQRILCVYTIQYTCTKYKTFFFSKHFITLVQIHNNLPRTLYL